MKKIILILGVVLLCTNSISQETQHEVTVTLKLVQVYVTDSDGKPVTDLNISDFEIFEDGKRKSIAAFEKHNILKPRVDRTLGETRPLTSRTLPTRMNRKFILILDYDRNTLGGVVKAKKSAMHFIDTQLQPDDEIGVLSYSKVQGFRLHEYLTDDLEKISKTIQKMKELPGRFSGDGIPLDISNQQAPLKSTYSSGSFSSSGSSLYSNPSQLRDAEVKIAEAGFFISGMHEIAKALRFVPGYKQVLLFSEGISRNMIYALDQRLRERYEDMIKEMSGSNCLVYSINTEGSLSYFRFSEDRGDHTLQMLSEQTGGRYFEDVQHYEEIADQIQSITSNFYILGYYIDEKQDGKFHKVKVEVQRKDCEVLSQSGYFNPKPYSKYNSLERQLHFIDLAFNKVPFSQEPIHIPFRSLVVSSEYSTYLLMLAELQLNNMKQIFNGNTEIATIVIDQDNEVVDYTYGDFTFPSQSNDTVCHYRALPLPHGEYECRIVIRDTKSGYSAAGYSKIKISDETAKATSFSSPLILIPETETSYVKSSLSKRQVSLSLNRVYPFVTNMHAPLMNEISRDCRTLHIAMRFVTKLMNPKLNLIMYIENLETEQQTPLVFKAISSEKKGAVQMYFFEVELPELKSGEYCIGIASQELITKTKHQMTHEFRVK